MKFCSSCGHTVMLKIPDGDSRARHVCNHCGTVHYTNPRNVVGTIPTWHDRILMCRRAIEPGYGLWTLPSGFLEEGETTREGAARETLEEAGALVSVGELYAIAEVRQIHHVYLFFIAGMRGPEIARGSESLEVRLFEEGDIPWEAIAFPAVTQTLRRFVQDRSSGRIRSQNFRVHMMEIDGSLDIEIRPSTESNLRTQQSSAPDK